MKITFLGTNGWFNTYTGNTTCVMLNTDKAYIILDAGGAFYKTYDIIKTDKPIYILLTHLHLDHIEGLQALPLFNCKQGITIITAEQNLKELKTFMQPPFMPKPENLKTKLNIITAENAIKNKILPFDLQFLPLLHPVYTVGYRIKVENKIITFGLDSGPCDNLLNLAQGADLFITECSMLVGQSSPLVHLNPSEAGQIALKAQVGLLALIHFKADDYNTLEKRDEAIMSASTIFPKTFAPYDGDFIDL